MKTKPLSVLVALAMSAAAVWTLAGYNYAIRHQWVDNPFLPMAPQPEGTSPSVALPMTNDSLPFLDRLCGDGYLSEGPAGGVIKYEFRPCENDDNHLIWHFVAPKRQL